MLEILLLIYLSKKIGTMASEKGHSASAYKAFTFLCWFGFEIIGAVIGLMLFKEGFGFYILGLASAAAGYGLIYFIVNGLPDKTTQEVSQVSTETTDNWNNQNPS